MTTEISTTAVEFFPFAAKVQGSENQLTSLLQTAAALQHHLDKHEHTADNAFARSARLSVCRCVVNVAELQLVRAALEDFGDMASPELP